MEDRYRLTEYVMQIKYLEQERDCYGPLNGFRRSLLANGICEV